MKYIKTYEMHGGSSDSSRILEVKVYNYKDLEELIDKLLKIGFNWHRYNDIFDEEWAYSANNLDRAEDLEDLFFSTIDKINRREILYNEDGSISIHLWDDNDITFGDDSDGCTDVKVVDYGDEELDMIFQARNLGLL